MVGLVAGRRAEGRRGGPIAAAKKIMNEPEGRIISPPLLAGFLPSRLGWIEIQVQSNLDRGRYLALYLVQRTNFEVK